MSIQDKESEDLSLHVELCAQRYKEIGDRFDKIEIKIDQIQKDITDSKRSMSTTLITSAGTIVSAIIGLIITIMMKF